MASCYLSISSISNPSPIIEIYQFCCKCRETQKWGIILDNFSLERMFTNGWKDRFIWCFPYYVQCLQILLRFIRSHQVSFNITSNSIYLSHSPVNSAQLATYISVVFGFLIEALYQPTNLKLCTSIMAIFIREKSKHHSGKMCHRYEKTFPDENIFCFLFYWVVSLIGCRQRLRKDRLTSSRCILNLLCRLQFGLFQKWKCLNFGQYH